MYLCTAQPYSLCIFQSVKKSYQLYSACSKCRFQRFMTQSNQNQFAPEHSKALLLTEGHFYAKFQLPAWGFFLFFFLEEREKFQKILVMVKVVFFTSFMCQIVELHSFKQNFTFWAEKKPRKFHTERWKRSWVRKRANLQSIWKLN